MADKFKKTKDLKMGAILSQKDDSSMQYKTGTWKTFRPVIDESKCIHCVKCVHFCPENCIALKGNKRSKIDLEYCKGCGVCAKVCPVGAIKMIKEEE